MTETVEEIRSLLSTTPFDTVSAVLERRAVDRPRDAPILLAVAAWCEVIRDDIVRARRLASQALGSLRESVQPPAPDRTTIVVTQVARLAPLLSALADVIEALGGSRPFDHASLDVIADEFFLAESDDERQLRLHLAWMLEIANWYTFADRYSDAARILHSRLASLDPEPDEHERVSMLCCLAELEFRRGRWDSARASSLAAIDAARQIGEEAGYAHSLAARIEAGRARHSECDVHVKAAWALSLTRGDESTQWRVVGAEAFGAASKADWTRSRSLLEPLARRRRTTGVQLASVRLWDGDYLESLARLGDKIEARRHLDGLRGEAAAVPTKWTSGVIARGVALIAQPPTAGIDSAEESVAAFDEIGAVFEAARSRLVLGELLLASDHADQANATLRSAALTFASLGASAWLDRVNQVSASCTRFIDDAVPPDAFDVLTPHELDVAMAIIDGATNREVATRLYVSVKTVETHITRIYRKLQVRSRAELVAAYFNGKRTR
jgi:ATP/maltotriose-dependent transcriptional regulator MalT